MLPKTPKRVRVSLPFSLSEFVREIVEINQPTMKISTGLTLRVTAGMTETDQDTAIGKFLDAVFSYPSTPKTS